MIVMKSIKILAALFIIVASMFSLKVIAVADKNTIPEIDKVYFPDEYGNDSGIQIKNVKEEDTVDFVIKVSDGKGIKSVKIYLAKQDGLELDMANSVSVTPSFGDPVSKKWQATNYTYNENGQEVQIECYCVELTDDEITFNESNSFNIPFSLKVNDKVALNEKIKQKIYVGYTRNDGSKSNPYDYQDTDAKIRVLGFKLNVINEAGTALPDIGFKLTKGEGTEDSPFKYYKDGYNGRFQEEESTISTDANGQYIFDSLDASTTYTLTNVSADNYVLMASSVTVDVDANGNITFDDTSDNANTLNIQLATKTMLPATGGSGRLILYIIGCTFIGLALVMICFRKKFFSK